MRRSLLLFLVALLAGGTVTASAQTGQGRPLARQQAYVLELGARAGAADGKAATLRHVVRIPDAPWLRLHFSDTKLGRQSYLMITSLLDGGRQRLDAKSLAEWRQNSAFFNGEAVEVELHTAPGEEGIFVRVEELTVGEIAGADNSPTPQTICGANDDRVASTDARVGRINQFSNDATDTTPPTNASNPFCTAWLVSNGALLTAGHCVDFDPDGPGPGLPDGTADATFLNGVVEFSVPASQANGTTVFANPNNQYPINNVVWRFDGQGQGLGKDWAVFAPNPNSNTGLLPHQAQGAFFRMTREAPATNNIVRVTGYGLDNTPTGTTGGENAQTRTLQTHSGTYAGENNNGTDFSHTYQVDTTGANSGSPIIWESNGFSIGIHTNAGCTSTGGSNSGTSFEHDALETRLQNYLGPNTVHVDNAAYPNLTSGARNGNIFQPFATVSNGVDAVPTGGTVSIVAGTYNDRRTFNRAMTLRAPSGPVIIGQ